MSCCVVLYIEMFNAGVLVYFQTLYIQVEKTLKMKKGVGMALAKKVMKQEM